MLPIESQTPRAEQFAEQQRHMEAARKSAALANAEVQRLLAKFHHREEPQLPETEAVLRCHSKRRLYRAVKQASSHTVANWLFESPSQMFHPHQLLTRSSFSNAIGISSVTRVTSNIASNGISHIVDPTKPKPPTQRTSPIRPGKDLLLIPVAIIDSKLIGYTFGGVGSAVETIRASCAFGEDMNTFFPHTVGRFSYDSIENDLLMVTHCLAQGATGIWNVRADTNHPETRERVLFIVPGGPYKFRRMPGRILSMIQIPELRCPDTVSRYQFSVSDRNRVDGVHDVQDVLGKLERLIKGHFFSEKMCRDDMDEKDGQVLSRITTRAEIEFDAMDAIRLQIFKDIAVRLYYSYMAAAAAAAAAATQTQPNIGSAPGESGIANGNGMTGGQ